MKSIAILLFFSIKSVFGTNSILFGPDYPNRFACYNDVYGIKVSNFMIPKETSDRVTAIVPEITRILENPEEVGIERELVESALIIFDENKTLKIGLVYPSIEFRLQMILAKDYVASQSALASLNTLKGLTYIINILRAYSKTNLVKYTGKATEDAKYGLCSIIVYDKIVEKLVQIRARQLEKIKIESKRIRHNINQLGRVKSTGRLYLLISGSVFSAVFSVVFVLTFSTLYSLF